MSSNSDTRVFEDLLSSSQVLLGSGRLHALLEGILASLLSLPDLRITPAPSPTFVGVRAVKEVREK